jgi:hypothetical protein
LKVSVRVVRPERPPPKEFSIHTRRSGSRNGSGRMRTAFTTLNIAVQTPIPRASVRTATAAKPGSFDRVRTRNRTCRQNSASRFMEIS